MKCLPYNAVDIAKYVINKSIQIGHHISNIQLQFYLYTIQVEHIRKHGICAFMDRIEVWDMGPVVTSVYAKYRHYGACPIPGYPQSYTIANHDLLETVDEVCERYAGKIAFSLVTEVHDENTPYSVARKAGMWHVNCNLIEEVLKRSET